MELFFESIPSPDQLPDAKGGGATALGTWRKIRKPGFKTMEMARKVCMHVCMYVCDALSTWRKFRKPGFKTMEMARKVCLFVCVCVCMYVCM